MVLVSSIALMAGRIWSQNTGISATRSGDTINITSHTYPAFYRGLYLTVTSGKDTARLKEFIQAARNSNINAFVIDAQMGNRDYCVIPKENVDLCLQNGIHPIARVVVFTDGLSHWPVAPALIQNRLSVAADACKKGFKEIQFDYIRFTDYRVRGRLTVAERYAFIEGFLARAREHLRQYNVKTAADIFGRIPLNKSDAIGQRMEGLDKVVDIICPMAYPSHYTWSKKLQADPYYTVFLTSKKAKERTKQAEIVSWIQAFQMKVSMSGLSFEKYIEAQIKASHDAGIRGYILWNARNDYRVPLATVKSYYQESSRISRHKETPEDDETL
jgi:hypothetical protein